jgi:peptide/nickel transport system substrate-binding protein
VKRNRYLALLAAAAMVLAACSGSGDSTTTTAGSEGTTTTAASPDTTGPSTGEKVIIIGTTDSIANLDSADAYAVHDWEILRNTGVPLTRFVPGSTEVEPGIAESWEPNEDGTVYTFHLRDDVVFGDGTPLTAELYVRHLNRMLSLAGTGSGGVGGTLGTPYIACVTPGAEEGQCDEWGVKALDDYTVEIQLTGAYAYFPQLVATAAYVPSHPSLPEDQLIEIPSEFPFYGVGAWILESYTPGEQSVFVPNPHYFGEKPNADKIIVRYYSEASQLVAALAGGDIDIAWRSVTEPQLLETVEDIDGVISAVVPGGGIRYFIMNHNMAPTDNLFVRQAIAASIDRDEIIDRAFGGNAEPLYSTVPPGFLGANEAFDDLYEAPNLEKARDLLTQAGYSESNPLQLQIDYPPNRYGGVVQDAIAIVKEQLEATGMIEVTTKATEWATYLGEQINGAYAMGFLGWFFDFPDSSNYVEPWLYSGGLGSGVTTADNKPTPNLTKPELIDLAQQAATELDPDKRAELYAQIQNLWAEDVVTIPLWFEPERIFYRDYISVTGSFEYAESLNIGPTTEFTWALLDTSK